MHERAKTIPVAKYDTNMSMRIWLSNFEMQAKVQGVTDLDLCGIHISHYMPTLIQQWLPTLAPDILASWSLLKEALIARFGVPADVDNQRLLKDLKRCRKGANESIRLHATKWEHLLNLISDDYTEDTKINLFIQSLDKPETRLALIAIQAALKLDTITKVIQQAIELEVKAKLIDQPEILETTPMDVDNYQRVQGHYSKRSNKGNKKPKSSDQFSKPNNTVGQNTSQISTLFDVIVF